MASFQAGLQDVVALQSKICFIDGQKRELVYGGYDIGQLIGKATFEEVIYLLWHGALPNAAELSKFKERLKAEMHVPEAVVDMLRGFPKDAEPMAALRTAVSSLGLFDPEAQANDQEANERKAVRLVAKMPMVTAFYDRLRNGQDIVKPDPELGLAANFLYMLRGERPAQLDADVLDASLILHADHELNASTFAARVAASTLSDVYSAVTGAIGTLKGPLHGGANEQVMITLSDIGEEDNVEPWLTAALDRKERIMGFGHRVYRTGDPRADYLRKFSEQLGEKRGELQWFRMSRQLEQLMDERLGLYPNVDFYSASTYHLLGIPTDLFTPVFAFSRVSGWTAHVLEQLADNRLIRPRAEYVGPRDLTFVPVEQR